MDKISILDYVVPSFGNKRTEPYGKLEVEINGEKRVIPFGEKENRGGRIFVKATEEREIRNVGSLYSPKFEFVPAVPKLEEKDMTQLYAAVYCCGATRDVQICKGDYNAEGADLNDEIWEDCPDAEVFIGFFSGTNTEDIRAQVAKQEGCKKSSVLLIPARTKPQDSELEYMLRFATEADFDLDELPAKQLRALWTAYCFHKNLDVDTQGYDKALQKLWAVVMEKSCSVWSTYDTFDKYMAAALV